MTRMSSKMTLIEELGQPWAGQTLALGDERTVLVEYGHPASRSCVAERA
jgi:hypothetical protein